MKLFLVLTAAAVFAINAAYTQGCLSQGITFITQAQIDSFAINYPGCNSIEGNVIIQGIGINNLNGLNGLISIGGILLFHSVNPLNSLSGLDSLNTIGGDLIFMGTGLLNDMTGLGSLASVGGDLLIYCHSHVGMLCKNSNLISLAGLEALADIGGNLSIFDNPLTTLDALSALTSIGGDLSIARNDSLISLSGIENIDAGSIANISIAENYSLSACNVQSICSYLISPNGTVEIHGNAPGCNNPVEVATACGIVGLNKSASNQPLTIIPNPTSGFVTITFSTIKPQTALTILTLSGQEILHLTVKEPTLQLDLTRFPAGMYFVKVSDGKGIRVEKLIKQ